MTPQDMETRIVRYGDLQPCRTAFIDAHTPGSDQKENFTIIGAGVTESPHQHIHIRETPGFNIGAAGQPPMCRNSLHSHTTAEVFFVLKGTWRFFWGRHGTAGEVVAQEGDIFNIPTGIFRGFENVGTDYGMIMAILGGDDAGGGVTWAPQVIEDAADHGLVLGENGMLYDTKAGEALPVGVNPMPLLTEEELKAFPEVPVEDVVRDYVARYWDLMALARDKPARVIGADGLLRDRPGFDVEFLSRGSIPPEMCATERHEILMPVRGHWRLSWNGGTTVLNPGDTCAVPPGMAHALAPSMTGEASLYRIRSTDDPAGATWSS
ncbi:MAG TPA: cupin [Rhodobacteraceae bacterium]|nr:cupin [Paracoccaceae bacterium]